MENYTFDDYLHLLINQPLLDIGRAYNIIWLCFGEFFPYTDKYTGKVSEKSTLALHLQCSWRIVNNIKRKILVASHDLFEPNTSIDLTENFNWDVQGGNLFDERSKKWLKESSPIYVTDLKLSIFGDLSLAFSNNDMLEVFVDKSSNKECWRFFELKTDNAHLVVSGKTQEFS
ncbi:MAG: hypothetical protein LBR68_03925 [Lachnoclostridium sp.]|nr:hypothetical protein [Lachnoclostridium sp.]